MAGWIQGDVQAAQAPGRCQLCRVPAGIFCYNLRRKSTAEAELRTIGFGNLSLIWRYRGSAVMTIEIGGSG